MRFGSALLRRGSIIAHGFQQIKQIFTDFDSFAKTDLSRFVSAKLLLLFQQPTTDNRQLTTDNRPYLGLKTKKGTIISSNEIPPC